MFGRGKYQLRILDSEDRSKEKPFQEFVRKKNVILYKNGNFDNVSVVSHKKKSFVFNHLENFQTLSSLERRRMFFKSLNLGDVFYFKVIQEQPDCYKLLALDKYKGSIKIDDLSIVMELPKFPQELKYLSSRSFDYIKAALSACNVKERVLYVTLDSSILKDEFKSVLLGPIYSPQMTHYHSKMFSGKSCSDKFYLTNEMTKCKKFPEFSNVGANKKTFNTSSYLSKMYGEIPLADSSSHAKSIQMQKTSLGYFTQAKIYFENEDLDSAMLYLEHALSIWDENYEALLLGIDCCTLKRDGPNAFLYAEKAFKLFQKIPLHKEPFFQLLLRIVHIYLTQKNTDFALAILKMAKIVDPSNRNVCYIYDTLLSMKPEN